MVTKMDRKKWREGLKKKQKESYDRRDDSGRFKPIFIEGITKDKFWKPAKGEHQINIIPYFAGDNNPNTEKGEPTYLLDIWVHPKVGPNDDNYVCPSRNYNKPCPICEHQQELRDQGDYDETVVKDLSPKRRVLYNIECVDTPIEQAKGIQLFEVSHFSFEKPLTERSKLPRGGGFIYFADPDEGKVISFEIEEGTFKKGNTVMKKVDYKSFQFIDREEPISDELLQKAYVLDDIVEINDYDKIYEAFFCESSENKEVVEKEEENKEDDIPMDFEKTISTSNVVEEDECPIEKGFGKDFDQYMDCDECKVRLDCGAEYDKMYPPSPPPKKKEEPKPKSEPRRRPGR